eukprot:m.123251 g.123251  ORF g.123251 m.123251 type:complete len:61 (-) comp17278_c2_seq17:8680-8862(-)
MHTRRSGGAQAAVTTHALTVLRNAARVYYNAVLLIMGVLLSQLLKESVTLDFPALPRGTP